MYLYEIKSLRKKFKLSQTEFGRIVHAHWSTVSNWERGRSFPGVYQLGILQELRIPAQNPEIRRTIKKVLLTKGTNMALATLFRHLIEPEKPKRRRRKS